MRGTVWSLLSCSVLASTCHAQTLGRPMMLERPSVKGTAVSKSLPANPSIVPPPPLIQQTQFADLAKDPSIDPMLFRLLVRAVGVIPVGSVVELESGQWAVVVGPSADPRALDRPRLRIVTDASGRALTKPVEVDLGVPSGGQALRITRLIEPKGARFSPVSAFLR